MYTSPVLACILATLTSFFLILGIPAPVRALDEVPPPAVVLANTTAAPITEAVLPAFASKGRTDFVPPSQSESTLPAATVGVTATIAITGANAQLHYNPGSGLLYVVDADETVTIINGTTVSRRYLLAEGSDSCGGGWCARFVDIPGTQRTYISVPDTDTTSSIGAFDATVLAGTLTLPNVMDLAWNNNDGHLYLDSRGPASGGRRQTTTVIADTQVITSMNLGDWYWTDSTLGPHQVNTTNGLVYRTRPYEVIALQSQGVMGSFWTAYYSKSYDSYYVQHFSRDIVVNSTSGRTYSTGVWWDYDLKIGRPVVSVIDGLQRTATYTFTETSRNGDVLGIASDPHSASVYVVISRCNDTDCQYEVIEFVGDSIQSRLPLQEYTNYGLQVAGIHPYTGELYLVTNYWPQSTILAIRHGQIVSQFATFMDANFGGYAMSDFADNSSRSVFVTTSTSDSVARYHLFQNGILQGIIELPDRPTDIELARDGLWVSRHCFQPQCVANTKLYYFPFTYFQSQGNWIYGRVVDAVGTPMQGSVTLTYLDGSDTASYIQTDSEGRFSATGLPAGRYAVKAQSWTNEPYSGSQIVTIPPSNSNLSIIVKPESANTTEPVVFIPGIAGSYLFEDQTELWPALFRPWAKAKLSLNPSATSVDVRAPSPLLNITVPLQDDREIYRPLTQAFAAKYTVYTYNESDPATLPGYGCNPSQPGDTPTFFLFPYDWRKDIVSDIAPKLSNYINNCVRQFHPDKKINIVAHSMGGLVARQYILQNPQHNIGKVITIGTPWLGAPKTINGLLTGKFLEWLEHRVVIGENSLKDLLEYFPGAHQLFPSKSYYNEVGRSPFVLTTDQGIDCRHGSLFPGSKVLTFDESMTWLNCMYPESKPSDAIGRLHTAQQDDWRTKQDTGVQYYIIYGQTATDTTIGGVARLENQTCIGNVCIPVIFTNVFVAAGDGTVPLYSSTRQGNGKDLNGQEATLCRAPGTLQEHLEMTKSPDVQSLVLGLLDGSRLGCGTVNASEVHGVDAYYLTVNGSDLPLIVDGNGNTTHNEGTGEYLADLPQITLHELDDAAYLIVLPKDQVYTVTMPMTSTAVLLKIEEGSASQIARGITYRDFAVTQGQDLRLRLQPTGISELTLDSDNNGSFETTVPPFAEVTGPDASDMTAPVVTISATMLGNGYKITIAAQDANGISTIRYSLDGTSYQTYAGPFTVQPGVAREVIAFADDVAGNRSQLVTYELETPAQDFDLFLPSVRK